MRQFHCAALATIAVISFASVASAAPPPPVYSWTGCYVGGNVGYGLSPTNWSTTAGMQVTSHNTDGVVGGGQIGCDYQRGQWVYGIKGMLNASGMKGIGASALEAGVTETTTLTWIATFTGRVGYTIQPMTLVYAKGGVAWVRAKYYECCVLVTDHQDGYANVTRTGWTLGGGVEHIFRPKWSYFVEYDFINLGTNAIDFTGINGNGPFTFNIKQDVHLILTGINYRF